MSKQSRCDFCDVNIGLKPSESSHTIKVDSEEELDICGDCFSGTVILSERRRSKTRKQRKPRRRKSVESEAVA